MSSCIDKFSTYDPAWNNNATTVLKFHYRNITIMTSVFIGIIGCLILTPFVISCLEKYRNNTLCDRLATNIKENFNEAHDAKEWFNAYKYFN